MPRTSTPYVRADRRFPLAGNWAPTVKSVMDRVRASGDKRSALPGHHQHRPDAAHQRQPPVGDCRFGAQCNQRHHSEPSAASTVPSDLPQAGRSWYVQATLRL
ncbi:MAG: hypothetical protein IPH37_11470 [Burkholderiales bacterium]|nr:hypothetical protein [Burkholderiales bacterium]